MKVKELQNLLKERDWYGILENTCACLYGEESVQAPSLYFFRAIAQLELGEKSSALDCVEAGLVQSPSNRWGQTLAFKCRLELGYIDIAFEKFEEFVTSLEDNADSCKVTLVDTAVQHERFDLAVRVNETREVIKSDIDDAEFGVAIQCFNKPDTLERCLSWLLECNGKEFFSVVILQDSEVGSNKEKDYTSDAAEVKLVIAKYLPKMMQYFRRVQIVTNRDNRGTAPSCRILLDLVASQYSGFIFIEDDCLLTKDALFWTIHHLKKNISLYKYWFATCESIYFNTGALPGPSEDQIKLIRHQLARSDMHSNFVELDFVPSTCFITTSNIWQICRGPRSLVRGPESLTAYLQTLKGKTISPIVPRALDVGMLHTNGYSVAILGKDNVKEHKNTYLWSQGEFIDSSVKLYSGSTNELYSATVNMDSRCLKEIFEVDVP